MMKRVKRNFRAELPHDTDVNVGVTAVERGGNILLTQPCLGSAKLDSLVLSPAHCDALGMTAVLEDAPEPKSPGQIVREAEVATMSITPEAAFAWHELGPAARARYEAMAIVLGIKGES